MRNCKGSILLGTGCEQCPRCKRQRISLWLDKLSPKDEREVTLDLIERLLELEELWHREAQPDFGIKEDIYWESCGESIVP